MKRGAPWLYRLVVATCPKDFRRLYAADMIDLFEHRLALERSRGLWRAWRFVCRSLFDTAAVALRLRHGPARRSKTPASGRGDGRIIGILQDSRFAVRSWLRKPSVPLAVVVTLSLSIGAATAMFSVLNSVLLAPLPYPQPDRLVRLIGFDRTRGVEINAVNLEDVRDWANVPELESAAAYATQSQTLSGLGDPERIRVARVSEGFFRVLAVDPGAGRFLAPEEFVLGAERALVVSYGFWQRYFGGEPDVLGQRIRLDDVVHTVVGVMPPSRFQIPSNATDAWAALLIPPDSWQYGRGPSWLSAVARRTGSAGISEAQASLDVVAERLGEAYPETNEWRGVRVRSLRDAVVGSSRPMLFVLSGAVGVILLVGCASAANLLLARAGERRREFAVRAAIGAGSGRLTRQLLTEGVLLSTVAGGIGVILAYWSVGAIVAAGGNAIPRQGEISIDWRVLVFSGVVTIATGVLFALVPAVRVSRIDLARDIQDTANAAGASPGLQRLRSVLVVGEMTLSVVLLIGGALLAQSLWRLGRADLGFDASRVTSFDVSLPTARYGEFASVERFFDDLTEELSSLPGVARVAAVDRAPLASGTWTDGFAIGVREPRPGEDATADFRRVTDGYFETLGIPLQAGRAIRRTDRAESPPVVVVNRALVDRYFDGQDPIGNVVTTFGATREIVGVVGTVRHRALERDGMPTMYFPWRQMEWQAATVLLQAGLGSAPGAAAIRERVRGIDPQLPIGRLTTMTDRVSGELALPRFRTGVVGGLSSLALLLSLFGVYSVVSYSVMLRSREIGIRVALGSGRGAVSWLVARQGLVLAGLAAVLGMGVAFGLSQVLDAFLYGVARSDLRTFVAVPIVVLGIGFLASLVPAIQASRADPVSALRE